MRHRSEGPGRARFQRKRTSVAATASLRRRFASTQVDVTAACVLEYLENLATPRALAVWLLYQSGEHLQLVQLTMPSSDCYDSVDLFRRDYAATKLFSKTEGLRTGIDTDAVALASALSAEEKCKATNHAWRAYNRGVIPCPEEPAILRARDKIARILGDVPASFVPAGWSPGRTTMCDSLHLSSVDKFASDLDATPRARGRLLAELRRSPQWSASVVGGDASPDVCVLPSAVRVAPGNVMRVVPKNAKTGRVICFEPHGNIFLQLAVGKYIRERLRLVGVNLNDQSVNQRRALKASIDGLMATLDLKSASDTLAIEVVFALLPIDWALLLDDLRSHATQWPGETTYRRNEKFSSMGNGFTFELESLIFYALASAVSDQVSVYGDDIICATASAPRVIEVLRICGFDINPSKSFITGPFRESCGMDGFRGVNVTPVYLRRIITSEERCVAFHNGVRSWVRRTQGAFPERRWLRVLDSIRSSYPLAPVGPEGFGDGHYHVDFDAAAPQRAAHGVEGWWFTTVRVSQWTRWERPDGRPLDIPGSHYRASLCASLAKAEFRKLRDPSDDGALWAPRLAQDVVKQPKTGKLRYKTIRALAHRWPELTWV